MKHSSIDWSSALRDFREAQGLKQYAAADYFGVSQATISRWEKGTSQPTIAIRSALIKATRRSRSPIDSDDWMSTFRQWLCPGQVLSVRGFEAITQPLAAALKLPIGVIEGAAVADVITGEALELRSRSLEDGAFSGRLADVEICCCVDIKPDVRRGTSFHYHQIAWPHLTDDGEIVLVYQGAVVSKDDAKTIRARLGGPLRNRFRNEASESANARSIMMRRASTGVAAPR